MKRVMLLLVIAALFVLNSVPIMAQPPKPNILIILTDDVGLPTSGLTTVV